VNLINKLSRTNLKNLLHCINVIVAQFYSCLNRVPVLHVFGDSHSNLFFCHKNFLVHNVGPATAYNLINDSSSTKAKITIFKELNHIHFHEPILFIFGEIDCRIHIYNKYIINKSKNLDYFIKVVVKRYISFLKDIQQKGYKNIILYSLFLQLLAKVIYIITLIIQTIYTKLKFQQNLIFY